MTTEPVLESLQEGTTEPVCRKLPKSVRPEPMPATGEATAVRSLLSTTENQHSQK